MGGVGVAVWVTFVVLTRIMFFIVICITFMDM